LLPEGILSLSAPLDNGSLLHEQDEEEESVSEAGGMFFPLIGINIFGSDSVKIVVRYCM
jgi:hypothetical protein